MLAISTDKLTKTYKLPNKKTKKAVHDLDIEVPEGSTFGFLGPNGAGKTTTIKIILNFLEPTSGQALIFGKPVSDQNARKHVGYLPEQPYFPKFLKPLEVVRLHAQLSGLKGKQAVESAMEALATAGIEQYAQTPLSKLSKGLTQRVAISQALVNAPRLLLLDEPTSGLDPISRRHTRDVLCELKAAGVTIFLSSHVLSEIEEICDTVAIMKNGKLLACGPPEDIRSRANRIQIAVAIPDKVQRERLNFLQVDICDAGAKSIITSNSERLFELMHALEAMGITPLEVNTSHESLEEAFLRIAA